MIFDDLVKITYEAGNLVKEGFYENFEIEYKGSESNLVTEIDKKSEKLIIDFIRKKYPDHAILAEESGEHETDSEFTWVIDPIDGTTNFAHGLPLFSVTIGVRKNGQTIAGTVYEVMRDEMYKTELGCGAYCNDTKISVSTKNTLPQSLLVTGFPYDIADNPNNALEIFSDFTRVARGIRRLGSAAIDFCYVARGVFDGFWEVNLHPWDMCAGVLLVQEAGGKTTDFSGNEFSLFGKEVLSTNGRIHNDMIKTIEECRTR